MGNGSQCRVANQGRQGLIAVHMFMVLLHACPAPPLLPAGLYTSTASVHQAVGNASFT